MWHSASALMNPTFAPNRVSWWRMLVLLAVSTGAASADPINWESLQVNTIQETGGFGISFGSLPDGRFVLGQQQKVFVQDAFGASGKTEMATNGITFDPSFVAVRNGTSGLMGAGGSFGTVSGLHPFDPTNAAAGTGGIQPALSSTAQSYVAVYWHSPTSSLEGWLIGGANGTNGPFSGHNVIFVSLDGTKKGSVTQELCTYSAGMATDAAGNLYTALYELDGSPNQADADKVIRFSAAQIEPKIQAIMDGTPDTPLARSDALFVFKFGSASSIAVDAAGRVWASGFRASNVQVFDPATGAARTLVPTHPAINGGMDTYQLSTFTRAGTPRIGILAYDSWMFSDTPLFHVHAPISEVSMPGASTFATWRIAKFGAESLTLSTEDSRWGQDADPDLDGLSNLVEYSQGTEPLTADDPSPIADSREGGLLTLSFRRDPAITDLIYAVQVSDTMAANDWAVIASSAGGDPTTASGASDVDEVDEGALKRVTVVDQAGTGGDTQRFMRLKITTTPP